MKLRIGTRRSRLATTQATQVCELLCGANPGLEYELVLVETTGDKIQDRPLSEAGGKGLFVKELDEALLDGRIDCAIHSLKDVPSVLLDGIVLAGIPRRADAGDRSRTRLSRGENGRIGEKKGNRSRHYKIAPAKVDTGSRGLGNTPQAWAAYQGGCGSREGGVVSWK